MRAGIVYVCIRVVQAAVFPFLPFFLQYNSTVMTLSLVSNLCKRKRRFSERVRGISGCPEWSRPSTSWGPSCRERKRCLRASAPAPPRLRAWSRSWRSPLAVSCPVSRWSAIGWLKPSCDTSQGHLRSRIWRPKESTCQRRRAVLWSVVLDQQI